MVSHPSTPAPAPASATPPPPPLPLSARRTANSPTPTPPTSAPAPGTNTTNPQPSLPSSSPSPPSNPYSAIAGAIQGNKEKEKSKDLYVRAREQVLAGAGSGSGSGKNWGKLSDQEVDWITLNDSTDDLRKMLEDDVLKENKFFSARGQSRYRVVRHGLEGLERFQGPINTIVSNSPSFVGYAWAGIRALMVIAREVFDVPDKILELAKRSQACIQRFDKYIEAFGVDPLRDQLVSFYSEIIRFSLHCYRISKESWLKNSVRVFKSSIREPFEQLLEDLGAAAEEVDKMAYTEDMASNAKHRKEMHRMNQFLRAGGAQRISSAQSPQKLRMLPRRLSRKFTGRGDLLNQIWTIASAPCLGDKPQMIALHGLPGVGKSQTTLAFAEKRQNEYPFVFFVQGDTAASIEIAYREAAQRLKLVEADMDPKDTLYIAKLHDWFSTTCGWLLIFDNIVDVKVIDNWIPTSGTGAILYTTRNPDLAEAVVEDSANALLVEPLALDEAVRLVMSLRDEQNPQLWEEETRNLCKDLGCLPVALEFAVAYAKLENITLITVRQRLKRKKGVLNQQHATSRHEKNQTAWAMFLLALEKIEAQSKQARALMNILVYFDTASIPASLVKQGSNLGPHLGRSSIYPRGTAPYRSDGVPSIIPASIMPASRSSSRSISSWKAKLLRAISPQPSQPASRPDSSSDIALQTLVHTDKPLRDLLANNDDREHRIEHEILRLRRQGLLSYYDGIIWIHDLVRDIVLEDIGESVQGTHKPRAHLAMTMVYLTFPQPRTRIEYPLIYNRCLSHQPHALSVLGHCKGFEFDATIGPELMHMMASFMHFRSEREKGSWLGEAVEWYGLAFAGYFRAWGRQRSHLAKVMQISSVGEADLAIAREERMIYDLDDMNGNPYFRVHEFYERFGGPARRMGDTALKLAVILFQTDPQTALKWTMWAIRCYKGLLGINHIAVFHALGLQVTLHEHLKQYPQGLEVARERAEVFQKCFDEKLEDGEYGAQCCLQIATMLEAMGDLNEALRWCMKALEGRIRSEGMDSPRLSQTVLVAAKLNDRLCCHYLALDMEKSALELSLKGGLWEKEGATSFAVRVEMATTLLKLKKGENALEELERVCRYLTGLHLPFEDLGYWGVLSKPIWLKCAWTLRLAQKILGEERVVIPPEFRGRCFEEAEEIHGKVEDALCYCCSTHVASECDPGS